MRPALAALVACFCVLLPGCAVIAVADTVATIAAKGVGLAAVAAIGTVRIGGKVVGAAANAVLPTRD